MGFGLFFFCFCFLFPLAVVVAVARPTAFFLILLLLSSMIRRLLGRKFQIHGHSVCGTFFTADRIHLPITFFSGLIEWLAVNFPRFFVLFFLFLFVFFSLFSHCMFCMCESECEYGCVVGPVTIVDIFVLGKRFRAEIKLLGKCRR